MRFHLRGQTPVLIDCAHLFLLFWLSRTLPRQDDFVFCLVLLLQIAISLSIFCPNLRLFLSDAILNLAQQIKFYPAPGLPGQKHCKLLKSICSVTQQTHRFAQLLTVLVFPPISRQRLNSVLPISQTP